MALQMSTALRNAMLDQWTSTIGGNAQVRIYSGVKPTNCAAALSGNTLLAQLAANATLAPAASGGVLTLNSITNDSNADATGTASFYRVYDSSGTTCHSQGNCGTSGSDMNLNTTSIVAGAVVSITSWTITAPGA